MPCGKIVGVSVTTTDLRPYLRTLDRETLAELVHQQAERDPELRKSLEARAMAAPGDLAEAHRLLDAAVTGGNFEYATKVGSVLDTLQRLLDAGSRAALAFSGDSAAGAGSVTGAGAVAGDGPSARAAETVNPAIAPVSSAVASTRVGLLQNPGDTGESPPSTWCCLSILLPLIVIDV